MQLVFLGTGGYHPDERRHTARLLSADIGVALDADGFFRVQKAIRCSTLDVFLTHAHLDHICGLTFILVPLLRGDLDRVRVFGSDKTVHTVNASAGKRIISSGAGF